MKKTALLGLSILVLSNITLAEYNTRVDAVIYATPLIYSNSQFKDKGYFTGAYLYYGEGLNHLVEARIDYTNIKYKNGAKLQQYDLTVAYSNFSILNYKLKAGIHYIFSDDTLTDRGIVALLDITRYKLYQWNVGIEGYATYYKNYSFFKNGAINRGLYIFQINPRFGFNFGNYYTYGRFYLEVKPYYIRLSEDLGIKQNYYSVETTISYYIKNWTVSAFGYYGKQVFPVKSGGFIVFNVAEERKYGYGAGITYTFYPRASISINAFQDNFEDLGLNNNAKLSTIMLSAGYTF